MKTTKITDQDIIIIERFNQGDARALSLLIERHKSKIYTCIFLLVRDDHLADDIFQNTFVKAIDRINKGKYVEEGKFLKWILRIAHNQCIDHFRSLKRKPLQKINGVYDIFETITIPANTCADDKIVKEERNAMVLYLLGKLPENQREVVIFRHYAGLSFKEISAITHFSVNTCLSRMNYALMNLRKIIKEENIDF